jgi:carboxylesterase type B
MLNSSFLIHLLYAASVAVASPIFHSSNPTAIVNGNEIITGKLENNVETFKGIPFAEPPLGNLRFRRPVDYNGSYHGLIADNFNPSCMQINPMGAVGLAAQGMILLDSLPQDSKGPLFDCLKNTVVESEDCLYLNIFRPAGTKAGDNLPVMVWIHGGAFLFGSPATFPGNKYVEESIYMDQPIIMVSIPYRFGPYGYLNGPEIVAEGNTNVGLHDLRKALIWIQTHIADFGGDPDKVTAFGESAGAMSIAALMASYKGTNSHNGKPLFNAAIMQSGGPLAVDAVDASAASTSYNRIIELSGCGNADDKLACLRSLPAEAINKAHNSYTAGEAFGILPQFLGFTPRPDGDILSKDPLTQVQDYEIQNIPVIVGNQEDEGTIFAGLWYNVFAEPQFRESLFKVFMNASQETIDQLAEYYPRDWTQGSPFRTGHKNAVTPQFKRYSALLTDVIFQAPRRLALGTAWSRNNCWNYFSTHFYKKLPIFGTFHGNELLFQFFVNSGPYLAYRRYFISFANNFNPNVGTNLTHWDQYTTENRETMEIKYREFEMQKEGDRFREEQIVFLNNNPEIRF